MVVRGGGRSRGTGDGARRKGAARRTKLPAGVRQRSSGWDWIVELERGAAVMMRRVRWDRAGGARAIRWVCGRGVRKGLGCRVRGGGRDGAGRERWSIDAGAVWRTRSWGEVSEIAGRRARRGGAWTWGSLPRRGGRREGRLATVQPRQGRWVMRAAGMLGRRWRPDAGERRIAAAWCEVRPAVQAA